MLPGKCGWLTGESDALPSSGYLHFTGEMGCRCSRGRTVWRRDPSGMEKGDKRAGGSVPQQHTQRTCEAARFFMGTHLT